MVVLHGRFNLPQYQRRRTKDHQRRLMWKEWVAATGPTVPQQSTKTDGQSVQNKQTNKQTKNVG